MKYPSPKATQKKSTKASLSLPPFLSSFAPHNHPSLPLPKSNCIIPSFISFSTSSLQVTLIIYSKQPFSMEGELCEPYPKDCDGRRIASSSSFSCPPSTTSVHVTALDGLVNVNSLFTIAVFVGLSLTTPNQHSLENRAVCDAGIDVARRLLVFEVVSFSFFLFSSLIAQGLKLAINLLNSKDVDEAFRAHINIKVLRFGMLGSAVGSVLGCLFLMLSMVNVIEIRLGLLSCGSRSAVHAVAALVILVSTALLVYISTAVYAFLH